MRRRYQRREKSYEQMIQDLDLGKYTEIVAEVVRFVHSDNLLKPIQGTNLPYTTITDFEQAQELAFYVEYDSESGGGPTLSNIFEHEISDLSASALRPEEEQKKQLDNILHEMYFELEDVLDQKYKDLVIDSINYVFCSCAKSRLLQGKKHAFLEEIFNIYKQGFWPCGWDGTYPEGQLIVYAPPQPTND